MKKCLVVGVIFCLILVSIPIVVGNENISYEGETVNNKGLMDNINIRCKSTYKSFAMVIFLFKIFNKDCPLPLIDSSYGNDNHKIVSLNEHYRIKTGDGRLIYEENRTFWNIPPNGIGCHKYIPLLRSHLEEADYLKGPFYMIVDYQVVEDGSHKTLLYRGYFYGIGALLYRQIGIDIT